MVTLIRTSIIAFLALYLCSSSFVYAKRVALVIGNGVYQETLLKNPVNDANDMAKSLETLGFEVIKVTDANLRNMYKALDDFTLGLSKKDIALFFYAGHGVQVQGENYLLPIDSRIKSVSDIRYEAFPVGRLIGRMEEVQSMNIIILDACRNNPLSRGFNRSLDRGLAIIQRKPEGTFIAYATAPGKTAADGDGENGLFTTALLKHIQTAGLNISTILRKVRTQVKKMSFGEQIPWSESSLTEEFFFKEKSIEILKFSYQNSLQKPQSSNSLRGSKLDSLFWESIKDSKDSSTYEAYIQQFPNGIFKPLALLRITKYSKPKIDPVEQKKIAKYSKPKTAPIEQKKEVVGLISLRNKPKKIEEKDLTNFIHKYNFFDSKRNFSGSFDNNFKDNGDNTITDTATGLIWQKGGSQSSMVYLKRKHFINKLNATKFAGYSDWRLPTLEELASLLQDTPENKFYINDIFGKQYQKRLWGFDLPGWYLYDEYGTGYILDIESGTFKGSIFLKKHNPHSGKYRVNAENWVKAVRKINIPK